MARSVDWAAEVARLGQEGLRRISGASRRAAALARGQRFYCRALSGESSWNISVNANMTVSCSCQDVDGQGEIGDLRHQSFEEIFAGETAMRFRRTLAAGDLPLSICGRCQDLAVADPTEALSRITSYRMPRVLMVENTSLCNLRCVSCGRERLANARGTTSLSLDDVGRIARLVKEHGIEVIVYHKLGEPFLSRRIGEELALIRSINPTVRIHLSTNGTPLKTDRARQAALGLDSIYFSIDGVDTETLSRYQRTGDFDQAYRNLKDLVAARDAAGLDRPVIGWRYVLFSWNDRRRHLPAAIRLAREANVDYIQFRPTFGPFYGVSWRFFLGISHPDTRFRWRPLTVTFRRPSGSRDEARTAD